MPLTKKEILKQLERGGVKLGKNPSRNFVYYQEKGLLPDPVGIENKEALYPDYVPRLIKKIRKSQKDGFSLDTIKLSLKDLIEKVHKEIIDAQQNRSEIHKFLNLNEEGQTYTVSGCRYRGKEPWGGLIIAYYPDRITWYRIKNPNTFLNYEDSIVIDKKTLTVEHYGDLVKNIAMDKAKNELRRFTENDELDVIFAKKGD